MGNSETLAIFDTQHTGRRQTKHTQTPPLKKQNQQSKAKKTKNKQTNTTRKTKSLLSVIVGGSFQGKFIQPLPSYRFFLAI